MIKDTTKNKLIKNIQLSDVDWSNIDKFQCTDCMKGKATKHKYIVGSRLKCQNNCGPFEYLTLICSAQLLMSLLFLPIISFLLQMKLLAFNGYIP